MDGLPCRVLHRTRLLPWFILTCASFSAGAAIRAEEPPGDLSLVDGHTEAVAELKRAQMATVFGGSDDVVVRHLTAALRANPELVAALRARLEIATERENWRDVLDDALLLERLTPADLVGWLSAGVSYLQSGDHRAAVGHLSRALEMTSDPHDRRVILSFRGFARLLGNSPLRALDDLDEAAQMAPVPQFDALWNRAYVRTIVGASKDRARDEAAFAAVIAANPLSARAYKLRATYWFGMEEFLRALADLEQAAQLNPHDPEVLTSLANLFARDKAGIERNLPRAEQLARRACELTSWRDTFPLESLAYVLSEKGDFRQAFEYQRLATFAGRDESFNPESPVRIKLGWRVTFRQPALLEVARAAWQEQR